MFGKKTVDSVLSTFRKTLDDLETIGREQMDAAEDTADQITDLQIKLNLHRKESHRAVGVANKLRDLIS